MNQKDCITHLRHLARDAARKRYFNVPDYAITTPMYSDKTANGLTRCIIDWIRLNGGQAERINCVGRVVDKRQQVTDTVGFTRTIGSVTWIPTAGQRGTADISAVYRGFTLKVEVKIGRDKQSSAQAAYQRQTEAAGGLYFIARNFGEFYQWFESIKNNGTRS